MDRFEADHIVSLKKMTEFPDFHKLTREEKLEVANLRENFIGLGKRTNASKQDKNWTEWPGHKELGPVPDDVRSAMQQAENTARQALQVKIQEILSRPGRNP